MIWGQMTLTPPDTWFLSLSGLAFVLLVETCDTLYQLDIIPICDNITELDIFTESDILPDIGFPRASAMGVACRQGTLTPPDTWSCPILGLASVLMLRLNLSWTCLVSGLLSFEHPSVLLFLLWVKCVHSWHDPKSIMTQNKPNACTYHQISVMTQSQTYFICSHVLTCVPQGESQCLVVWSPVDMVDIFLVVS